MPLPIIARVAAQAAAKKAAKEAAKEAPSQTKTVSGIIGRKTGSRAARDTKEPTEYTPEMSGNLRFRRSGDDEFFETRTPRMSDDFKKGGKVKGYASGGSVTRADGCVTKGHTKGKMVKMMGGGKC
jgi:hypothetical protein